MKKKPTMRLLAVALFFPSSIVPKFVVEAQVTCASNSEPDAFYLDAPCGNNNGLYTAVVTPLEYPTELTSGDTGSLEVTLTVSAYILDATMFSFQSRSYCYNDVCGPVGPTLRVKPGDSLTVTLINNLEDTGEADDTQNNELRHPNYVNVHTHGLHIDPAVDNVIVHATPGETLVYEYEIPEDHMAGTHWYHSHVHGSSALQVMGGLLGAIVVEPSDATLFPATYTAMTEHLLVFSHISLCSCNPTNNPFRIIDYQELRDSMNDSLELEAEVGPEEISDVYLTNGQYQPTLSIAPGEWVRLEMVNAVGDTYTEIELRDELVLGNSGIAPGCEIKLLALDGVFLFNGVRSPPENVVLMNPASRASIAIMCSTTGTRYLQTNPGERASDFEVAFFQNLLSVDVTGEAVTMQDPDWTADEIPRPFYLQDLRGAAPTNGAASTSVWQVGVEQTFAEGGMFWVGVGKDCGLECPNRNCEPSNPNSYGSCPYVAFGNPESPEPRMLENYPYRHVGKICDVEDMVIQGRGKTPHPIHIHVNHFQVVETDSNRYPIWGEIGDWRDTIGALSGTTRVRYVLDKYGGNIMIHCHFLFHEDQGMMDRIWVDSSTASDDLRCTATSGGSVETQEFCDLSASDYSISAFDDNYPSIISQCSSETVACTAVNTPTSSCLVQTCTTDLNTPYTGCDPALCTNDTSTPHEGCIAVVDDTASSSPSATTSPSPSATTSSNPSTTTSPSPSATTSSNPSATSTSIITTPDVLTEECFSPFTMAIVKGNEGQVHALSMEDLRVGDRVLTGTGRYQMVYSIDHRNPTKLTTFLQISYENKGDANDKAHRALNHAAPLEITGKHMMFVQGKAHPVPANTLRVGDFIQTVEGYRSVTIIASILRKGVYNPLTTDGTIVASGIIASTYSAFDADDVTTDRNRNNQSDEWFQVGKHNIVTYQDFFDAALKPYQYMCTKISIDLCNNNRSERVAISEIAHNVLTRWQLLSQSPLHVMTFLHSVSGALIVAFVLIQGWLWKYAYGSIILVGFAALCRRATNTKKEKLLK